MQNHNKPGLRRQQTDVEFSAKIAYRTELHTPTNRDNEVQPVWGNYALHNLSRFFRSISRFSLAAASCLGVT